MQRTPSLLAVFFIVVSSASAQFQIQTSNTTADLRGIDSISSSVAWASGSNGAVLRTHDGGKTWQTCSVPPNAEHLDFRGIQAFDPNTAIVMSSGKGDLSRLYKTSDGCRTWSLLFSNPDPDGFWDALILNRLAMDGELLGDPVNGKFAFWETEDKGNSWQRPRAGGLESLANEGAFAASNSSILLNEEFATAFVTGGTSGARILTNTGQKETEPFKSHALPLAGGSAGAGAFSVDAREACCWVVVGGDYTKPEEKAGTAAYTRDGGKSWHAAQIPPHGFRSAVVYDRKEKIWITVGPNGADVSLDDGRTWYPLQPKKHDAPDADKNWNAISLPFAVGPKGRIGKLDSSAIDY